MSSGLMTHACLLEANGFYMHFRSSLNTNKQCKTKTKIEKEDKKNLKYYIVCIFAFKKACEFCGVFLLHLISLNDCHQALIYVLKIAYKFVKICSYIAKRSNYFNYPLFIFSDFGPAKQKLQKMEPLKQLFACGICHKSFNLAISLSEHVELHRSRKEPKNSQKMPRIKVAIIDTIGKTEEKTEKNIPKEIYPDDNSISIQHTINFIDPEKIYCKEESKDEPFLCNVCARKFTRHTFMINHRHSIYIRTVSSESLLFPLLN